MSDSDDEFWMEDLPQDTPKEIGTRYKIDKEIGKGAYGIVYESTDRTTGGKYTDSIYSFHRVAIKVIENVFQTRTDAKRTLREISILRQCNHRNIYVLVPPNPESFTNLWVIQDYGGWDLARIVKNSRKITGWSATHVKYIVYQMLCGLFYMQSAGIVHRDLKPSNILMSEQCDLKIIDFGLARQIDASFYHDQQEDIARAGIHDMKEKPDKSESKSSNDQKPLTQHVVTRWYRAPELCLLESYYNAQIDMWSVGCIMAELIQTLDPEGKKAKPLFPGATCYPLSNRPPGKPRDSVSEDEFNKTTHQVQRIFDVIGTPNAEDIAEIKDEKIRNYLSKLDYRAPINFGELYPYVEKSAIDLLERMLKFNPKKRITVKDALEHEYLKAVRRPSKETTSTAMSFPFEQMPSMSIEQEKTELRKLIVEEANLFHRMNSGEEKKGV